MKSVGHFNLNEYMERLYEEAEEKGGPKGNPGEGLIIPAENKKHYDWLKKEYDKGKVEVKVEMKMGGGSFKPSMDFQTDQKSVKEFKPGVYGGETSKTPDAGLGKKDKEPKKAAAPAKKSGDSEAPAKEKKKPFGVKVKGAITAPANKKAKKTNEQEDDE